MQNGRNGTWHDHSQPEYHSMFGRPAFIYRVFIKNCFVSLKFCDFSELCQCCCSAGFLPAWCVYILWHRGKTESGIFFNNRKKTQYLMNTLYIPTWLNLEVWVGLRLIGESHCCKNRNVHKTETSCTRCVTYAWNINMWSSTKCPKWAWKWNLLGNDDRLIDGVESRIIEFFIIRE